MTENKIMKEIYNKPYLICIDNLKSYIAKTACIDPQTNFTKNLLSKLLGDLNVLEGYLK